MEELFIKHKEWLESQGQNGTQLILDNADMTNAKLNGKLLHEAKILECDFSNKCMAETDFENSLMCSSIFNYCTIDGCNFRKSDLQYSEFKNAKIMNTSFAKADLYEADFENATLSNSKMINACLYLANFSNVKFKNIDFSGTVFEETILVGAEFKNIIDIDGAIIKSINIGTFDNPIILLGDEAKKWIQNQI